MNVQILSKKLTTPSSPTPSHFRNRKVSWLSMFQSPLMYLPNIFYYPSSTGGEKKVEIQKRFVFNGAAISKMKAVASTNILGSRQPTRVEVVTALMWKALTMVARAKHGRLRPSFLVHSFNLRGKIAMPVPDNSLGNFTNPALARFTADDDENKVELDHFGKDSARISSDDYLFSSVVSTKTEMIEEFHRSDADFYMFNSWCRMPVYEVDFGWGKPGWFSAVVVPGHNMFHFMDTKDGDGIEAWVSLEEDDDMLLFQENPDIKAFTGQE
ncbi:acetyl-CoA-benzylalcohol acetyltransferase [Salix suchowensis]|nr:acetyl-CoA-benzylalcohol acetyltransferase [Salix suchowensis]